MQVQDAPRELRTQTILGLALMVLVEALMRCSGHQQEYMYGSGKGDKYLETFWQKIQTHTLGEHLWSLLLEAGATLTLSFQVRTWFLTQPFVGIGPVQFGVVVRVLLWLLLVPNMLPTILEHSEMLTG